MRITLTLICLCISILANSQEKINLASPRYFNTRYILSGISEITKVDFKLNGTETLPAPKDATFVLIKKIDSDTYLIQFDKWNVSNH